MDVAVLMACRNRKDTTLSCLASLHAQTDRSISLTPYIVDDGSTDGTYEAVREQYPDSRLIRGTGDLYWNGATRLAMAAALLGEHEYFLLLNDDVTLSPCALRTLGHYSEQIEEQNGTRGNVIVGALKDPGTGDMSYGGLVTNGRILPLRFVKVVPNGIGTRCCTFNANCVLFSRSVAEALGLPSKKYTHVCADFDYGLRANEQGFPVRQAGEYVGSCPLNPLRPNWLRRDLRFKERTRGVLDVKGLPPTEYMYYCRRHGGRRWVLQFVYPYVRLVAAHFGLGCVDRGTAS